MGKRRKCYKVKKVKEPILKDRCIFCGSTENLTRHHIFEKHFYPNSQETVILCQSCHSKFHTIQNQFLFRLVKDGILNYNGKVKGNLVGNKIFRKFKIWFVEITFKIIFH